VWAMLVNAASVSSFAERGCAGHASGCVSSRAASSAPMSRACGRRISRGENPYYSSADGACIGYSSGYFAMNDCELSRHARGPNLFLTGSSIPSRARRESSRSTSAREHRPGAFVSTRVWWGT